MSSLLAPLRARNTAAAVACAPRMPSVIMRHFGAAPRLRQDVVKRAAGDADRAHPHRRTISPALVRLAPPLPCPVDETAAIAGVRVGVEVALEQIDVVAAEELPRRNRDRQHGVDGEPTVFDEQRKVLGLGAGPFMNRADDV